MLSELSIHNFAIIDDLHLKFGQGLNILTGETGAGKSIIIDAIGLLLGDRAAADWVRAGTEIAQIEAVFRLSSAGEINAEIQEVLQTEELEDPDAAEWLTLSREVRRSGRNVCRVNGHTVNLQILGSIAARLIDVHGQGEHLNLLRPRTHIHLLDRFADLLSQRSQLALEVTKLREVRNELQRLRQDERTMAQRVDLLTFQAEEIFDAQLRPGEDEELEKERRRLGNAEALLTLAQGAQSVLNTGEGEMPSAVDMVGQAVDQLERLARIDPSMQEKVDVAQGLLEELSELGRDLQGYAEELEFNPERLQEVEDRLELIAGLKRKYGDTIPQILAYGEKAQEELEGLQNWEIRTAELEETEEKLLHTIGELGTELNRARTIAGEQLARRIEQELGDLNMARARFGVAVEQTPRADGAFIPGGERVAFDQTGLDHVEFLISTNPGEPLKPMAKIASGGETARLMLALKSVLTHADATPTLIFDEIDQGIGGRVGAVVGRKLWLLTGQHQAQEGAPVVSHQVLCITHLPQLAAFGDHHYTVNKRIVEMEDGERTRTVVDSLDGAARIEELTVMLGATGEAGRRSVEEMVAEVSNVKQRAKRSSPSVDQNAQAENAASAESQPAPSKQDQTRKKAAPR